MHEACDNHEKHQENSKLYVDKRRRTAPNFQCGGKVLVDFHVFNKKKNSFTSKLAPRRAGAYRIHKVVSLTTYEISSVQKSDEPLGKYHVSASTPNCSLENEDFNPVHLMRKRGRPHTTPGNQDTQSHYKKWSFSRTQCSWRIRCHWRYWRIRRNQLRNLNLSHCSSTTVWILLMESQKITLFLLSTFYILDLLQLVRSFVKQRGMICNRM